MGEIRARDEAIERHLCGVRREEEDYGKHIMSSLRMHGLEGFCSSLTSCCVCLCVCVNVYIKAQVILDATSTKEPGNQDI